MSMSSRKGLFSDMPTTVNHSINIDETDKDDLNGRATSSAAGVSTAVRERSGGTTSAIPCTTRSEAADTLGDSSPYHARKSRLTNSRQEHLCVSLTQEEYYSAIKLNPVIESYCKLWGAEPAWLPRVCGLSLGADGRDEGADSCSEDALAETLTEFSLKASPRSAVLSNARYISRFLVTIGMPYMISISPSFGLIICTPFYTTIPSAFPDMPDALFSMRNLTIDRVIKNPVFRHEFAFNSNLKVEVPSQLTEAINNRPFWKQLEYETEHVLRNPVARAPTPILPIFLNETKKIMLGIMPCTLNPHIRYYFDMDRLLDGGLSSDGQILDDLLSFIYTVLEAFVLPIRKLWVFKMKECFDKAGESPGALVAGFRIVIWLLNQTKIDLINAQVKERTTVLNESIMSVETAYYESLLTEQKDIKGEASGWLAHQPTIFEVCSMCSVLDDDVMKTFGDPTISKAGKLIAGFVWSVLRRGSDHRVPPPMFALDMHRIKGIQQQLNAIIMAHLESGVAMRCPDEYRQDLPRFMCGAGVERSPLFLLIEKRVLGILVRRILKALVGPFQPNEATSSLQHRLSSDRKESAKLDALASEVSTLLALHWRAAGFLYDDSDLEETTLSTQDGQERLLHDQ